MSILTLAMAGTIAGSAPAADAPPPVDLAARLQPLSDEELARYRGGFVWNGVSVALGAEIRSYLQDELVMQTNVSWSESGVDLSRYVSGALAPGTAEALKDSLIIGDGLNFSASDDAFYVAAQGGTAFLHRTDGTLQNIVLNTANIADVRQELDVQLDLSGFGGFEASALIERMGTGMADMLNGSILGSGL